MAAAPPAASLSASDLEELYAIRISLEALGIRLTVPRLRAKDLADLDDKLARMEGFAEFEDFEGWEAHHRAFHAGLVAHAGKRLVETIALLYDHAERYRLYFMAQTPYACSRGTEEHARYWMPASPQMPTPQPPCWRGTTPWWPSASSPAYNQSTIP